MMKQRAFEMLFSAQMYLSQLPHTSSTLADLLDAEEIIEDAALNMAARAEAMNDPLLVGRANTYADKWLAVRK